MIPAIVLIGPSQTLRLPQNPWMIATGLGLLGISSYSLVIGLPELMRLANVFYPNNETHNINFCSALFTRFYGIGLLASGISSSIITP